MKKFQYHQVISSVLWNLLLISAGSIVFGIGLKSIAIPHGFITGGISGLTVGKLIEFAARKMEKVA
jgi:uncharacterized membrane-anchored protein YitT (DUF2179 family)